MNGIDRVDNDKGYVPGNVSPCCWVCNIAKGTMSLDEWAEMVKLWSESINGI